MNYAYALGEYSSNIKFAFQYIRSSRIRKSHVAEYLEINAGFNFTCAANLFVLLSDFLPRARARTEVWANGSSIWNSRSKLSRQSILEIDVMSARTGQDTGLLYLPRCLTRAKKRIPKDVRSIELSRRYSIDCRLETHTMLFVRLSHARDYRDYSISRSNFLL